MKRKKIFLKLIVLFAIAVFSCKKEKTPVPEVTGAIEIHFDAVVGDSDLVYGKTYTNLSGENYKVSRLKYFISNIKLKKTDGTEYIVPQEQSYFLINEALDTTEHLHLHNIPLGDYNSVTFMVGVDSLRNTKPNTERTGVLDVGGNASGMYWQWNSGYIFFKLEGSFGPMDSLFSYHVGLFGGYSTPTLNNTRWVTVSSSSNAIISKDKTPKIHIKMDIAKVFDSTHQMKLSEYPNISADSASAKIADNYKNLFMLHHIEN